MDWLEQARELEQRGEIGGAIDLLEQAIAAGDESAAICKQTARLCLVVNEVRAFINYCHEAMRLDPSDAEPYLMIGRLLSAEGRWGEAAEALRQGLRMVTLTPTQLVEAEQLAALAEAKYDEWKQANPGYSNL